MANQESSDGFPERATLVRAAVSLGFAGTLIVLGLCGPIPELSGSIILRILSLGLVGLSLLSACRRSHLQLLVVLFGAVLLLGGRSSAGFTAAIASILWAQCPGSWRLSCFLWGTSAL